MSKRDDDELLSYVITGLQMIARSTERALQGNERFWAYDDQWLRRRRPRTKIRPAGPLRSCSL